MPRKQRAKPQPRIEVDGPAVVTRDFAQTRHVTTRAGAQKGWERLTVYEREFRLGRLASREIVPSSDWHKLFDDDGFRGYTGLSLKVAAEVGKAFARRDAAKEFDEGWAICNASWPTGFDPNRIKVAGSPGSFVDHQRDTKGFWRRIESSMGTNDWMICRRVCGDGYKVAEAVTSIAPSYRDETLVRFREALDALIVAMERTRQPQARRA